MLNLDVRGDFSAINRDLDRVQRKKAPVAAARALNRTNKGVVTDVVRRLSNELGIKPQKRVRRRVFIPRGRGFHATPKRLRAGGLTLFVYVPEIWLHRSKSAQKAQQGPNRFIATVGRGHVGLFKRKGRARLPMQEFLVDLSDRATRITDDVIDTRGADRWSKEFTRAMRSVLKRR